MADTTTELEVLDEIVDVLGGQSGQYETVVPTLQQIRDLLGGGGGYNPAISVGRADALTGADETAQWATRESTGSGSATVRSVQGAAVVIDGALVPVQIAGISSTDAQGNALDSVEWTAQTLRAAGSVRDALTAGELVTRVGVVDLGTLTWSKGTTTNDGTAAEFYTYSASLGSFDNAPIDAPYTLVPYSDWGSLTLGQYMAGGPRIIIAGDPSLTAAEFKASLSGYTAYYALATPTTTPISPALSMTYRVQAGGSESIIVPDGEVSAAPLITLAEGESAGELVMDALACIAAPDGPVATANHSVGTYLTMQGKLYKVTSAIAVGETIAAGTNVTQTTVMSELLALTA